MKTIVRMDPLSELAWFAENLNRPFGQIWNKSEATDAIMPLDVYDEEHHFVIKASVPGIKPEELSVSVEDGVLSLRGEHRAEKVSENAKLYRREVSYGTFARSIRLPENVDIEKVDAVHENGIITVRIPKIEEPKPKAIEIPVRRVTENPSTN